MAVRRKLDRVIVPLTTFLYLLCFLDRYTTSPYRVRHPLTENAESTLGMLESRAWQKNYISTKVTAGTGSPPSSTLCTCSSRCPAMFC
ncbi:hypothetical protein IG631_22473 [Alternaria alternata]|nr:hypothetical protein IG631_22473 [Alternaria alternata]